MLHGHRSLSVRCYLTCKMAGSQAGYIRSTTWGQNQSNTDPYHCLSPSKHIHYTNGQVHIQLTPVETELQFQY